VGALRETLAGDVALVEIPETRRMSTTAERSAGCDLWSLRNVIVGFSGVGSESRQRRVAAWSAPSPRETAMDFSQNPVYKRVALQSLESDSFVK